MRLTLTSASGWMKPLVLTLHINTTQDVCGFKDHKNLAIVIVSHLDTYMRFLQDRFVVGHEGRPETVKVWWYWVKLLLNILSWYLILTFHSLFTDLLLSFSLQMGTSVFWRYCYQYVNISSNISLTLFLPVGQAPDLNIASYLRWSSVTSKHATTEQKCSTVPSDQSSAGWTAEQLSCFQRRFSQVSK